MSDTMELKVKKRVAEAQLPTRTSPGAAGYDLYSCKEVLIPAQGKVSTYSTRIQQSFENIMYASKVYIL